MSYRGYYGKREAEPTAVAEAEADPYYGSYGYGGHGLSYRGYGRSYFGKREADAAPEADPTFRKNRKRRPSYRRSYAHSHRSYGHSSRSYSRSYPVSSGYRSYSSYGPSYSSYYY